MPRAGADPIALVLDPERYRVPFAEPDAGYVRGVTRRVEGFLRERRIGGCVIAEPPGDEVLMLYRERAFWVVAYRERGRGSHPAFFMSFTDAVEDFLRRATNTSSGFDWRDLPLPEGNA